MSLSLVGLGESLAGGISVPIDATEGLSILDNPGPILDEAVATAGLGVLTLLLNAALTLGGTAGTGTATAL